MGYPYKISPHHTHTTLHVTCYATHNKANRARVLRKRSRYSNGTIARYCPYKSVFNSLTVSVCVPPTFFQRITCVKYRCVSYQKKVIKYLFQDNQLS